jgi:hypothetical protein
MPMPRTQAARSPHHTLDHTSPSLFGSLASPYTPRRRHPLHSALPPPGTFSPPRRPRAPRRCYPPRASPQSRQASSPAPRATPPRRPPPRRPAPRRASACRRRGRVAAASQIGVRREQKQPEERGRSDGQHVSQPRSSGLVRSAKRGPGDGSEAKECSGSTPSM